MCNMITEKSWKVILSDYLQNNNFKQTINFVAKQYKRSIVYPPKNDIFKAFELCSFDHVRVVIIGQDPYHAIDQATGLAFSVTKDTNIPPSLQNIFKEIESDTGKPSQCLPYGDLTNWSHQGVLLLNSVLTVESDKPGSHAGHGWEEFTDEVIKQISNNKNSVVFLLWGAYAQKKGSSIDRAKHCVLESSHPSPLGAYRGFIGCKHFTQCNDYLMRHDKEAVNW